MKKIVSLVFIALALVSVHCYADSPTDPTAVYPFNGNADDASGNEAHGIIHGATIAVGHGGQTNSAYYLDGKNDFIELGIGVPMETYSISLWIKPEKPENEVSEWNHLVIQKSLRQTQFYINGKPLSSNHILGNLIAKTDQSLLLGKTPDGFWCGTVDDVNIFCRNLSPEEILGLYRNTDEPSRLAQGEYDYADSDDDGVIDEWDTCPDTPEGSAVDVTGCAVECSGVADDSDGGICNPDYNNDGVIDKEDKKDKLKAVLADYYQWEKNCWKASLDHLIKDHKSIWSLENR